MGKGGNRDMDAIDVRAAQDAQKMNRDELLGRVARRLMEAGVADGDEKACLELTHMWYEAYETELVGAVAEGGRVSFTGFGSYCMKSHKGHPVQFGSGESRVEDYQVFRFVPSNVLNRRLRHMKAARG